MKPKTLGQIAYEALAKRRGSHPDYVWYKVTKESKADYCAVASAVAREVNRRGNAKVLKLLGKVNK